MTDGGTVRARFEDYGSFRSALKTLKDGGVRDYEASGPINLAEIEHLMPERRSYVRGYATLGATVGLVVFSFMCRESSLLYSLVTGGKPPISNVPFVIVAYEGTILLGAIAALAATLALARLGRWKLPADYDTRITGDSFGISISCAPDDLDRISQLMRDSGAAEVST